MLKLFGGRSSPLFYLSKNGKTSYLLGSMHTLDVRKIDEPTIQSIIFGQKTLVTEPGISIALEKIAMSDNMTIDPNNNPVSFDICSKPFPNYYEDEKKELIKSYTNMYCSKYFPGVKRFLNKNDPIQASIDQLVKKTPHDLIFNNNPYNVNHKFIRDILLVPLRRSGMDSTITDYYFNQRHEIKGLDDYSYSNAEPHISIIPLWVSLFSSFNFSLGTLLRNKLLGNPVMETFKKEIEKLENIYLYQDFSNQEFKNHRSFTDYYLIRKRNEKWLPKIENYHEVSPSPLFVVGAMHLVGKHSVPKLLANKGYEVSNYDVGKKEFVKCSFDERN